MRLGDLLEGKIRTAFDDVEITDVTDDSSKVGKGVLFVCIKGAKFDGHYFAEKALEAGAAAVVCERDLGFERQIIVSNTRKTYGDLCAKWFGHPERRLKLIGVTGTNGKTTMTKLIKDILCVSGHKAGLIGTIQNEIGDRVVPTGNTTPPAYEFMRILREMALDGCDCAVMEVSSFALSQYRIGPSRFRVAVFTNLTQDHLDYHGDMESYYKAKKMLFSLCDKAIINIDDEYGKRLYNETDCEKYSYSINGNADFSAKDIDVSADGIKYVFCSHGEEFPVSAAMTGKFNVSNTLAAVAACRSTAIPAEKITSALSECRGVRGRCEIIPTDRNFTVICDYAHTPDALENVLSCLKEMKKGRLICLFGCGGNRDRTKRPLMAEAAAKYCDRLIVTSDNPRDEVPSEIIKDILVGLKGSDVPYDVIEDRRAAIAFALENATAGDVIVLAGKGHEDYQEIGNGVHLHFDEREVVREELQKI